MYMISTAQASFFNSSTIIRMLPSPARDIQALLNRSEASAISLSAVYRNLASLAEAGLILKSAASDGQETLYRFVGADACRDELHMTCLSCGQTTHVDHATALALAQALAGNDEFQMNLGQTTIYGLCKNAGKIICFLHKEGPIRVLLNLRNFANLLTEEREVIIWGSYLRKCRKSL